MTTAAPRHRLFKNASAKIASIPMVFTALVVFLGGTAWTIFYSFTDSRLLPRANWVGLEQYERLWTTRRWLVSIENLALYGVIAMVLTMTTGFVLAAMLDRKIRFENIFRTIILYPFALSFIVTGLAWQWILNPDFGIQKVVRELGWTHFELSPLNDPDTVMFGLLASGLWQSTGFIMCIMLAGMRSIDDDIWKAARVDGIGTVKTYLFVVLPAIRPVIITSFVLTATTIVKLYDLVVSQTDGGPGIASEVPAKYVIDYMFKAQNLGQGFAASSMMLLTIAIVLVPLAYYEFVAKSRHG